jgi:hypothetical protein
LSPGRHPLHSALLAEFDPAQPAIASTILQAPHVLRIRTEKRTFTDAAAMSAFKPSALHPKADIVDPLPKEHCRFLR